MPESQIKSDIDLKKAIIRLIAFFDMFDYPLTAFEIWTELDKKWPYNSVVGFLEPEIKKSTDFPANLNNVLARKNGFYFFSGREEIVETRQKRHNYGARKIKIARRFAQVFSLLPFVKMVALANSLGQHNLRDGSDIDFFIISAAKRVWLTRLYCTGLAKLANRRPSAKDKRDKICLSFYIGDDHLCLDDLRLKGEDPYFDYWRRALVLLYNKNKTYKRFREANGLTEYSDAGVKKSSTLNQFFKGLEKIAKAFQLRIMPLSLKSLAGDSDGVVINDSIIKLYRGDRRREYAEKYGNKVNEIIKKVD